MKLIEAEGLFHGDRMAALSDEAKLHWTYFFCASNSIGRIELNYRKILSRAFGQFKQPMTELTFWRIVRNFRDCYLLFIYKAEDGSVWGQWDVSERCLPRHKSSADRRSPAPNGPGFLKWKQDYIEYKLRCFDKSFDATNFAQVGELCEKPRVDVGVVVGVVVGVGVNTSPPENASGGQLVIDGLLETGPEPARSGMDNRHEVLDGNAKSDTKREPSQPEILAAEYALRMHVRHVKRKCSKKVARELIAAILRKHPTDRQRQIMETIDANHTAYCASWEWTKEGGQYCPDLERWLNVGKERYLIECPPDSDIPAVGMSRQEAVLARAIAKSNEEGNY